MGFFFRAQLKQGGIVCVSLSTCYDGWLVGS